MRRNRIDSSLVWTGLRFLTFVGFGLLLFVPLIALAETGSSDEDEAKKKEAVRQQQQVESSATPVVQQSEPVQATPAPSEKPAAEAAQKATRGGLRREADKSLPTVPEYPLPPTYQPKTPATPSDTSRAGGTGNVNPNAQMPSTGLDAYNRMVEPQSPFAPGASSQGRLESAGPWSTGQSTPGGSVPASPGSMGFAAPPAAPTPMSNPHGGDPRYGQDSSARMQQATAPRSPARLGSAERKIMRGQKPFSGYRPLKSIGSIYENLNSSVNIGSGVNTYYDQVQPQMKQMRENFRTNQDIRGLQETVRSGLQSQREELSQRPGSLPIHSGYRRGATFNNTGNFFPQINSQR
jgi:hypothetical protein